MSGGAPADPRLLQGAAHFNREEYFEAHESWEDLWHDTHDRSRDFIQGLIQVASALHHMQIGNMRGARLLYGTGNGLLAPYGDGFMGVDLKGLREDFTRALAGILEAPYEQLAGRGNAGGAVKVPWGPERAFQIRLDTSTESG